MDGDETNLLSGMEQKSTACSNNDLRSCFWRIVDPNSLCYRIIILLLTCFLVFGNLFCLDIPAALHNQILEELQINDATYMQLYSCYSWPNVIMCLIGGFLLDRVLGLRFGAILLSLFVLLGQLVFALGGYVKLMWLMDVGRFIFGVGGATLGLAQSAYAVLWFKSKELNLVIGVQSSVALIIGTVNMNIIEPIYKMVNKDISSSKSLGITLFIASFSCVVSVLCAIALAYLDKRAERLTKRDINNQEVIKLSDLLHFPLQLWILNIITASLYIALNTFIGLGKPLFETKFRVSSTVANGLISFMSLLAIPFSPIFGYMVDLTGYNLVWILLSIVFALVGHAVFTLTFLTPWVGMSLLGLSCSLWITPLFAVVPLVIPLHQLATAYGLMLSCQNLANAVVAPITGFILDAGGYLAMGVFFFVWPCVAMIAWFALYYIDNERRSGLNLSVKTRKQQTLSEEIDANCNLKFFEDTK